MMRVAQRKTRLVFETDDFIFERGQNRQIVIDAKPAYCTMRLKGQRRTFAIGYAAIYQEAIRLTRDWDRRKKKKAKR